MSIFATSARRVPGPPHPARAGLELTQRSIGRAYQRAVIRLSRLEPRDRPAADLAAWRLPPISASAPRRDRDGGRFRAQTWQTRFSDGKVDAVRHSRTSTDKNGEWPRARAGAGGFRRFSNDGGDGAGGSDAVHSCPSLTRSPVQPSRRPLRPRRGPRGQRRPRRIPRRACRQEFSPACKP